MDECIIFIGLDVHKETITVALAEEGKRGEVREYGRITNAPGALNADSDEVAQRFRFDGAHDFGMMSPRARSLAG
jgi:hypothetical protein